MDNATLKRVQQTVDEILLVIDRQAKACGVPYYLFYGSALGAVRHHGFIPWDDDADIVLFRKDFEKLKAYWAEHPVEGYFYQDITTDPGYHIKITKIRKNGTAFVEPQIKDCDMHHGMFVDIFVLDDYVQNKFLRRLTEYITMFDYNAERQYVPDYGSGRFIYPITNKLFKSGKVFRFWYRKVFPKLKKDDSMCSDIASFTNSHRYDFKREWLGEPRYVPYDDISLPIPANADKCLTVCYGDYMTPPPPEAQVSNHKLYRISFEEEYHPEKGGH